MRRIIISDVDGCLTDGKFVYTSEGKVSKTFGPHDNDGVKKLKKLVDKSENACYIK